MSQKAIYPFSDESTGDGRKFARDILSIPDDSYSFATAILDRYERTETITDSLKPLDWNQNKATVAGSEAATGTQVNSGTSQSPKNTEQQTDQSEQRGGSTMSDLHNTEYVDESRGTRSQMSPKTMTSLMSETPRPTRRRKAEAVPQPKTEEHNSPGDEVLPSPESPVAGAEAVASTPKRKKRPKSKTQPPKEPSDGSLASNPPVAPTEKSPQPGSPKVLTVKTPQDDLEVRKSSSSEDRKTSTTSTKSTTSEEESDQESEQTSGTEGDEGDSEAYTDKPLMYPDPSAYRDLDNASPNTIEMCRRHPCHYCFFVYFPSASVDEDLMPFRRKAFIDKVARLQNPDHVREVMDTKCARDAYTDRRITSIERQSGTEIRLSELNPNSAFIKGLPRRRLTIAGPSFGHIACALNLFEALLPKVVKTGVFPYRLPEGSSTRFASGSRQSSHFQWSFGRQDGTVLLRNQLDDKGGWRGFLVSNRTED